MAGVFPGLPVSIGRIQRCALFFDLIAKKAAVSRWRCAADCRPLASPSPSPRPPSPQAEAAVEAAVEAVAARELAAAVEAVAARELAAAVRELAVLAAVRLTG